MGAIANIVVGIRGILCLVIKSDKVIKNGSRAATRLPFYMHLHAGPLMEGVKALCWFCEEIRIRLDAEVWGD
jgi:hypothetical protein